MEIHRLTGYLNAQQDIKGVRLPPGALLDTDAVTLSLESHKDLPDFDQLPSDPALQAALEAIFKPLDPSYAIVVVDLSRPEAITWAALQPDVRQNVGSVGKLVSMLGFFDTLAQVYPDTRDRLSLLNHTDVTAGDWVKYDEHAVPKFDPATGRNVFSVVRESDHFNLAEWLDHMISASANSAGSVVWRETMLLKHFAAEYPPDSQARAEFFRSTRKKDLADLAAQVSDEPLVRAGFDIQDFRQGSFWTNSGKNKVPGTTSYATPRELARFFYLMEQGRLVDSWSSIEMKRFLYMTKRRYRYVYAPELRSSAVYFKSGSLYQCQAEEGFRCRKYMGNKTNRMNSVTLIESLPGSAESYRYIVAMISNVLKVNSAWDHSRLAVAIHQAVLTRSATKLKEDASEKLLNDVGKSDD